MSFFFLLPTSSLMTDHKKVQYEFFGPPGAAFITLSLPVVVMGLLSLCGAKSCASLDDLLNPNWTLFGNIDWHDLCGVKLLEALVVVFAWFLLQANLYVFLPGEWVYGTILENGNKLRYKVNALSCMFVSLSILSVARSLGYLNVEWLYVRLPHLALAAIILSSLLSVYLYASSFVPTALLAKHGDTGNPIYNFFIGRELNPRIGWFDLKYFCELRPGLIGWVVINLIYLLHQYDTSQTVSSAMLLVNIFQAYYVIDALNSEAAILTTMDITTDGFGFMLAFGDLGWVPFVYSLQARFLSTRHVDLSPYAIVAIVLLKLLGLYIFRGANSQKDQFRTNPLHPSVRNLPWIPTHRGTRLLAGGFWGYARHINYLGDWLMALSWCLPTGFASPITYFYFFYFVILLIHRERRDDAKCHAKYGRDWENYCAVVPWRIIPGIY